MDIKALWKNPNYKSPEPYATKVFFYSQTNALANVAHDKKWTWSEVRPNVIVGFVPTTNERGRTFDDAFVSLIKKCTLESADERPSLAKIHEILGGPAVCGCNSLESKSL